MLYVLLLAFFVPESSGCHVDPLLENFVPTPLFLLTMWVLLIGNPWSLLAIFAKRLRGMGSSAWWCLGALPLYLMLLVFGVSIIGILSDSLICL